MADMTPSAPFIMDAVHRSIRHASAPLTPTPPTQPGRLTTHPTSRGLDPLLSNLSPATILDELCGTQKGPSLQDNDARLALRASIAQASSAERAFGTEAALAAKKVQEWHDEMQGWEWPKPESGNTAAGFQVPSLEERATKRRRVMENGERDVDHGSELKNEDVETPIDEPFWGSFPARVVVERENRLEFIKESIEALNMERLKNHVLDVHDPSRSRPSSSAGLTDGHLLRSNYRHLDSFTAVTTATILQALPYLYRLARLLNVWSIRFSVLRKVPTFLEALEATQGAMTAGWHELERTRSQSAYHNGKTRRRADSQLSRAGVDTMRTLLEEKISALGKEMDGMLDTLEGREDTIPDEWLASLERLEENYAEWAVVAQERVMQLESAFLEKAVSVAAKRNRSTSRSNEPSRPINAAQKSLLEALSLKASTLSQDPSVSIVPESHAVPPAMARDVSVEGVVPQATSPKARRPTLLSHFSSFTASEREASDGEAPADPTRERLPRSRLGSVVQRRGSDSSADLTPAIPRLQSAFSSRNDHGTGSRRPSNAEAGVEPHARHSRKGSKCHSRTNSRTSTKTVEPNDPPLPPPPIPSEDYAKRPLPELPPSTNGSRRASAVSKSRSISRSISRSVSSDKSRPRSSDKSRPRTPPSPGARTSLRSSIVLPRKSQGTPDAVRAAKRYSSFEIPSSPPRTSPGQRPVLTSKFSVRPASKSISESFDHAQHIAEGTARDATHRTPRRSRTTSTSSTGTSVLSSRYSVKPTPASVETSRAHTRNTSHDTTFLLSSSDSSPVAEHHPRPKLPSGHRRHPTSTSKHSAKPSHSSIVESREPREDGASLGSDPPATGALAAQRSNAEGAAANTLEPTMISHLGEDGHVNALKSGNVAQRLGAEGSDPNSSRISSSGTVKKTAPLRPLDPTRARGGEPNEESRFSGTSADASEESDAVSDLSNPEVVDASTAILQARQTLIIRSPPGSAIPPSTPTNPDHPSRPSTAIPPSTPTNGNLPKASSRFTSLSADAVTRRAGVGSPESSPLRNRERARTLATSMSPNELSPRLQLLRGTVDDTDKTVEKRASVASFELFPKGVVKSIEVRPRSRQNRSRNDSDGSSASTPLPQRPRSSYLRTPPPTSSWADETPPARSPRTSAAMTSMALHDVVGKTEPRLERPDAHSDGYFGAGDLLKLPPPIPERSERRSSSASTDRRFSNISADRISSHTFGDPNEAEPIPEVPSSPPRHDQSQEESTLLADPSPSKPPPPASDDLEQKISSILTTIPAHIRLASKPPAQIPMSKFHPQHSSQGNTPAHSPRPAPSTPSFTLARAQTPNKASRSRTPVSAQPSTPASVPSTPLHPGEIRLYHLSRSTSTDPPLKLFVRAVGESGERVMVRVGGGWADLGDYLREYAQHHGRSADRPLDLRDLSAVSTPTGSVAGSANTPGTASYRSTPVSSRPGSALALSRPGSALSVGGGGRRPSGGAPTIGSSPGTPSFFTAATGAGAGSQGVGFSYRNPPPPVPSSTAANNNNNNNNSNKNTRVLSWSHMTTSSPPRVPPIPPDVLSIGKARAGATTSNSSSPAGTPPANGGDRKAWVEGVVGKVKGKRGVSLGTRTPPVSSLPGTPEEGGAVRGGAGIANGNGYGKGKIRSSRERDGGAEFGELSKVGGVQRVFRKGG